MNTFNYTFSQLSLPWSREKHACIRLENHIMWGIERASWGAYLQSAYYSSSRTIGRTQPSTKNGKRESRGILRRGKESERLVENVWRIKDGKITRNSAWRRRGVEGGASYVSNSWWSDCAVPEVWQEWKKESAIERGWEREGRGDEGKPLNLISGSLGACFPRVPHFLVSYLIRSKYE